MIFSPSWQFSGTLKQLDWKKIPTAVLAFSL